MRARPGGFAGTLDAPFTVASDERAGALSLSARPDGFLLAGRYTLLDHDRALQRVMPTLAERDLSIVAGGPYSSGALVGGPNFEYAPATLAILDKVARIKAIADRYSITMKAAKPRAGA